MKLICVLFILIVIGESIEYFILGPFDIVHIAGLIFGYCAFGCLMIGIFMWRKFYKLLNIYLFYTTFRVCIEFGFLVELTVATIIEINRKSDPDRGQFFESTFYFLWRNIFNLNITDAAIHSLFNALLAAVFLFTYILGVFVLYIEYKYLKGRIENGLLWVPILNV